MEFVEDLLGEQMELLQDEVNNFDGLEQQACIGRLKQVKRALNLIRNSKLGNPKNSAEKTQPDGEINKQSDRICPSCGAKGNQLHDLSCNL